MASHKVTPLEELEIFVAFSAAKSVQDKSCWIWRRFQENLQQVVQQLLQDLSQASWKFSDLISIFQQQKNYLKGTNGGKGLYQMG